MRGGRREKRPRERAKKWEGGEKEENFARAKLVSLREGKRETRAEGGETYPPPCRPPHQG